MPSEKKTREFKPRTVAVGNLFAENTRLQRLCAVYRRQIRGTQKNYELLKAKYQLLLLQFRVSTETVDALMDMDAKLETQVTPAQTTTVEETADAARN